VILFFGVSANKDSYCISYPFIPPDEELFFICFEREFSVCYSGISSKFSSIMTFFGGIGFDFKRSPISGNSPCSS
jgi:hypothetical protein